MVGLNDSCPCCGHKRRRSALDRLKSCPVSLTSDAILRPSKFARSSSLPSPSCIAAAAPPCPRILPPALPSPVLRPAAVFPVNLEVAPAQDEKEKGEEEKVETDSEKDGRKMRIRGAESVKITIKCKCGSVQEVEI